jgi:N-acetylglutamate synthase-like GNAT family acetyltransferase
MIKIETRELKSDEFSLAEHLWEDYHGQKADPLHDRIFGVIIDGKVSASARYVKHADGGEMDCVFVPETENGKGYARDAVENLIIHCGSETMYIHSTLDLIPFYPTVGFLPIAEDQLPPSIKERFSFCLGTMKDCNISPMVWKGAVVRPALPLPPEGIPRGS